MENVTNQDNLNRTTNESTLKTNVASQTSPPKETQPQNHVDTTEQPSGNQTGSEPVSFLDCSKNYFTNTQYTEQHEVNTPNGDTTTPPLTTATPLIEERLVRDEQTNEIYLPITSTVVLKRKLEMLYVPLDFENNLTVDALVDSRAFVSAIAQDDLETIKQNAPNNILKIDDPRLDLKMGIRPQQQPIPTSQIAQEVLEQTEMNHHDVRKNTMQAYIKYKAYYDKKANTSKLKEADYVYILQPKEDHQGSKIPFTEFRWIGPYKVLPNNNYLVCKIGPNKTQVLHRMRMRQFTPPLTAS